MKRSKLLALGLSALLTLSIALTPAAAAKSADQYAAEVLYELNLFQGMGTLPDGSPDFSLDTTPTREQAITMLVRLLGKEAEATGGSYASPFTDVSDWARPYVSYAYRNGLTTGTSTTTFSGSDAATATQYLTFLLRALGYTSGTDFQWDSAWTLTNELMITAPGQYTAATTSFTRGDVAQLSAASLGAYPKDSDATLLATLNAVGAFGDSNAVIMDLEVVDCAKDSMSFVFFPLDGTPANYSSFTLESVTVNGVSCKITEYKTNKEVLAANEELKALYPEAFYYCVLSYSESAALDAATQTYSPGNGVNYPLLVFRFQGTGTRADGSTCVEAFSEAVYINAYGG